VIGGLRSAIARAVTSGILELGSRARSERSWKQVGPEIHRRHSSRQRYNFDFADYAEFFGADPVGDEASVILGLFVIGALMAE
jgi:hypothetical protein